MNSSLSIVLLISLMLNLFVFIASDELTGAGITYDENNQPLSNYVDTSNPDSLNTGESVPTDINTEGGVVSSTLGIIDWLGKIWDFVTGVFKFFFGVYYLMVDMGINSSIAYLFGLPVAFAQMIGIFFFIRGIAG